MCVCVGLHVPVDMRLHTLVLYALTFFQHQYNLYAQPLPQPTHCFFYVMLFVPTHFAALIFFKRQKKNIRAASQHPKQKDTPKKTAKLY
jgi:hypothetical protein